ncbi:MAG TPA: efflux transporter outer membrane subunit [Verrucomicrobiae bacterium]|nr:efflux transporter outer membrane subunit [Verrucomicrobiae bacterium]
MKAFRAILRTSAALLIIVNATALPKVGPEYKAPTNNVPETYKASELGKWKEGKPADGVTKGRWWEIFNDATLSSLEERATTANPNLQAAFARVEQARSTARMSRAELLPNLVANPSFRRERYSPNQQPAFGAITVNSIRVPLDLSYEIDLWGRVRRGFEASRANAQAVLAAYQNALLTLQGDVAQSYFSLRALDAEIDTITRTLGLRDEQVKLVRSRFEGGIGNELDVARAETELAATESELAAVLRRRSELENGLAVLLGEFPSNFKLPPLPNPSAGWKAIAPEVPPGLPSDLLERRPDVAQAERELAAANARIGVAKASYFPVVTLTGSGGYLSAEFDNLFDWSSRIWSIGPTISMPIFAQARNRANVRRTRAAFEEASARYRSQVLVAFSEVEDNLSGIRYLAEQAAAQQRAVASSQRAADLARQRYESGISSYLEVVDANRAALASQRINAQLTGQRLIASVQLIKALGGGWNRAD